MDMNKEKNAYEKHLLSQGVDFMYLPNIQFNELENIYEMIEWDGEYDDALNELNSSWCTWQAAKASANQQFESFLNQAIEDSACADERRSLQVLLEDFQDNLEADKRKGQKRVAVNLEDL